MSPQVRSVLLRCPFFGVVWWVLSVTDGHGVKRPSAAPDGAMESLFRHGPWVVCRLSRVLTLYIVGIVVGFAGGVAMATILWAGSIVGH